MLAWLAAWTGCTGGPCDRLAAVGVESARCPDSELRLRLVASLAGGHRGGALPAPAEDGSLPVPPDATTLTLGTRMGWLEGDGPTPVHRDAAYRGPAQVTVTLLDRERRSTEVAATAFAPDGDDRRAVLALPDVPDGDYLLAVDVDAGFDRGRVEIPVSFYAPALVHVLTDRPLYRPGEDVRFRSLVLRAADGVPLGDRPGRWLVTAPDGVNLLTETDTAGAWGVADSELPLRPDAVPGTYVLRYQSGRDADEVRFEVRPFELPRVTAEALGDRSWFRPGDPLALHGAARYASGAPVADAAVAVTLDDPGPWPVPVEWRETRTVRTGPDGTFRLSFGGVPRDLLGRVELTAHVVVTEPAGESVAAAVPLVLSQESLRVAAVTELGDGLVGGVNNRAWLLVTTPDGAPLAGAAVEVRNPWDPTSPPKRAEADEDGVAVVQLDPGDPVTIVSPPMPVREAPVDPTSIDEGSGPRFSDVQELGEVRPASLAEARGFDRAAAAVAPCAEATTADVRRAVAIGVSAGGAVTTVHAGGDDDVGRCVAQRLRGASFPPGSERTFRAQLELPASFRPWVEFAARGQAVGTQERAVLEAAQRRAPALRSCFVPGVGEAGQTLLSVHWSTAPKSARALVRVAPGQDHGVSSATLGCATRALTGGLDLAEPASDGSMGVLVASLRVPELPGAAPPPPKPAAVTSTGYQLRVSASGPGGPAEGTLVLPVGRVPEVRLRATPSLALPGEVVVVEVLRGPDSTRELPEALALVQAGQEVTRAELTGNTARFTIPETLRGFVKVEWAGVRQQILVERPDRMRVSLATDRAAYRPGETAVLEIRTAAGDHPEQAAVGLSGVDATLGGLVPLPGPDELGRVTVRAHSTSPPFGRFDARALLLGRIRGRNAAQVAVQRVVEPGGASTQTPPAAGSVTFEPREAEVLEASFARALGVAARRVRDWERGAAAGDTFDNDAMVRVWSDTLAELRDAGTPALDAWGRELSLPRLPPPLLAQLDPRQLVRDGTHLPEDLVAWAHHVAQSSR